MQRSNWLQGTHDSEYTEHNRIEIYCVFLRFCAVFVKLNEMHCTQFSTSHSIAMKMTLQPKHCRENQKGTKMCAA